MGDDESAKKYLDYLNNVANRYGGCHKININELSFDNENWIFAIAKQSIQNLREQEKMITFSQALREMRKGKKIKRKDTYKTFKIKLVERIVDEDGDEYDLDNDDILAKDWEVVG